ncbi:MAG: bifunctional folylpolyglutamate synthase/dihydrofolate synthase, partial [Clostridia bacterium]|nr:bifunctional folylpolyglutamate synthase/dihydrofolate synthase [Clostridia bacterium]
ISSFPSFVEFFKTFECAPVNGVIPFGAMLGAILKEAGHKVGAFTSPYVFRFNERMAVNGEPIADEELAEIIEYIKPFADSMEDRPTEFELITAVGFEYFLRRKCDVVILEAGLGGRLDSTNVISSSLLSIITGIALDHTEILGDTTEKIALEKAGIIKAGCPVLIGRCDEDARRVIKNKANEAESPAFEVDYDRISDLLMSLDMSTFTFSGFDDRISISLIGAYQPLNAAMAITAAEILGIEKKHIVNGIKKAKWPARFEVIRREPTVIFDGSHNPEGIQATVNTVKSLFDKKVNVLTGVMADKEYTVMSRAIAEIADKVFCTKPSNPRALDSDKYAECCKSFSCNAFSYPNVQDAVNAAYLDSRERRIPLLVMGSLYLYAEFREAFDKI